jgi:hypothetical protein
MDDDDAPKPVGWSKSAHMSRAEDLLAQAHTVDSNYANYLVSKAQAEASLAVAYEQRTANLIAWQLAERTGDWSIIDARLQTG